MHLTPNIQQITLSQSYILLFSHHGIFQTIGILPQNLALSFISHCSSTKLPQSWYVAVVNSLLQSMATYKLKATVIPVQLSPSV